ncbi:MAG TPA: hypothetical protein VH021_13820 [Trebonia sp.]|nr:hypothetical protein [Trebonia sp.]
MRLQVTAAPAAAERSAARADRPDPRDELGQVAGEVNRIGGIVLVARAAGQPGLYRPGQRVAEGRLAECDRLWHREPGSAGQFPGGRRLRLEQAAGGVGIGALQRQPRGEPVADAEDGVDRAWRTDAADRLAAPTRELLVDQLPDQVSGDGQLIGVHGHGGQHPVYGRPTATGLPDGDNVSARARAGPR